jgi:hypothetical protein
MRRSLDHELILGARRLLRWVAVRNLCSFGVENSISRFNVEEAHSITEPRSLSDRVTQPPHTLFGALN